MSKSPLAIPEWKEPPQNTGTGIDARIWREYAIYHSADSDMCRSILELFGGQLTPELRQWLQDVHEIRKEQSRDAYEKADAAALRAFKARGTN